MLKKYDDVDVISKYKYVYLFYFYSKNQVEKIFYFIQRGGGGHFSTYLFIIYNSVIVLSFILDGTKHQ